MKCKNCNSSDIEVNKWIYGTEEKKIYHYIVTCNRCRKTYHTPRTKEVYELVKNKKWIFSKKFNKSKQQTLF